MAERRSADRGPAVAGSESAPTGLLATPYSDAGRVEGTRNMAVGLAGTTVAILTFTLFFLYPQDQAGKIDRLLFHVTLDVIIVALFAFGFAALWYGRLMTDIFRGDPRARAHLEVGNALLVLGLGLFTLAPALVLFTASLPDVGVVALVLWALLQFAVLRSRPDFAPLLRS